ncbi:histidine--tRNA ligase [Candidatus Bathyarchaeota archaeon]|nr:MAG: histidine--tRNA ligase [Candidatus Bathyarchaeota archaeon]
MYVFEDLGGRKVALRPEFTASVARLVTTKMTTYPKPIRLFSAGSLYRYDEPQFGRYREFWQANYELIGSSRPEADVEILSISSDILKSVNLEKFYFKVNHIGVLRSILSEEGIEEKEQNTVMQLLDKRMWEEALRKVEEYGASSRCTDTLRALFKMESADWHTMIRRVKRCVKEYVEALDAVENLCEILELTASNETEHLVLDPGFARGLEYYTGMIFEIYVPEMNVALGGGGRYDKLLELFGGESTPACGFALGVDRTALAIKMQHPEWRPPGLAEKNLSVLVIPVNDQVRGEALRISSLLREEEIITEVEVMGRSLSRALSDASRRGISHVVIVGPKELENGLVVLRNMKSKDQKTVKIKDLVNEVKGEL